jgi:hypothetical protein
MTRPLPAWTFDRDVDAGIAARVVLDQLDDPDLEVVLVASRRDETVVEVVEGDPADAATLYVARLGLFDIVQSDVRSSCVIGGPPRLLLTLRKR